MSMTSLPILAAEGGGHEMVWQLPIPAWSYGALSLAIFVILLGVVWSFRNAGHTYMTQPDIVEHGPATGPEHDLGAEAGYRHDGPGPGGHGSAH